MRIYEYANEKHLHICIICINLRICIVSNLYAKSRLNATPCFIAKKFNLLFISIYLFLSLFNPVRKMTNQLFVNL